MKIGMMSAWNEDSGVSIHAELIGREFVKMGHKLSVFSFFKSNFHGTAIVGKDEEYVSRCFTTSSAKNPFLDAHPILKENYDIFITQDLGMLPLEELAKIFPKIKRKAKTVTVIHHNRTPENPLFWELPWDKVIYFDDRYYQFLKELFPKEKLHLIPYPCHPKRCKDKLKERGNLALPENKYILFLFGQRGIKEAGELLPILDNMSKTLPILLLVVSKRDLDKIREFKPNFLKILIREETPDIDKLYSYLHASDLLLYHRKAPNGAIVSSTAYQCIGSFCPILALESNYFYNMDGAVITYTNLLEFELKLIEILNKGRIYQNWKSSLEDFLRKNSAKPIALQYIKLFQHLLEEV
ncbi:MAG: hypothetical protein AB1397_03015 [bacterium]